MGASQIKMLRDERGWTQKQLSAKSGIGKSYLSKLERGECPIGAKSAMQLASAFKVSAKRFLA